MRSIGWAMGMVLTLAACGSGARGVSGEVGRACMGGGRDAANPALCSCIQTAADQTLNAAEQRRAAGLFGDPQEAEDTFRSSSQRDNAFWDRYRAFADRAQAQCS